MQLVLSESNDLSGILILLCKLGLVAGLSAGTVNLIQREDSWRLAISDGGSGVRC